MLAAKARLALCWKKCPQQIYPIVHTKKNWGIRTHRRWSLAPRLQMKLVIPWQILLFSRIDFSGPLPFGLFELCLWRCIYSACSHRSALVSFRQQGHGLFRWHSCHAKRIQEIPGTPIPTIFEWMEMVISNQKPHVKIWFVIQLIANH